MFFSCHEVLHTVGLASLCNRLMVCRDHDARCLGLRGLFGNPNHHRFACNVGKHFSG
jgi:hypothetical protein